MAERVVLEGRGVRLEPLVLDHVPALVRAATEDRTTYGFTLVPADQAAMAAYVADALDEEAAGLALPFAVVLRAGDRVVGTTRYLDLGYWSDGTAVPTVAEIGSTWLAASAQRTATNTETKLLLLTHAFETWEVRRVSLKTDARNERSRRAIERLGARFEGIRRAHVAAVDGTARDSAYYSIISDEWPTVRAALVARLAGAAP